MMYNLSMSTELSEKESKKIAWSNTTKFVITDVDETLADLFVPVAPAMTDELNRLLRDNVPLFLVSGAGIQSIYDRVVSFIDPELRKNIIVSHCSGAEVCGFDESGEQKEPYYSLYDKSLDGQQKADWREVMDIIKKEFMLDCHPPKALQTFVQEHGTHPLTVMYDDRGPQITLEFINGYRLTEPQILELRERGISIQDDVDDLRLLVSARLDELYRQRNIPVSPRVAGEFALDNAIAGVSKETSVRYVFENPHILTDLGLSAHELEDPHSLEVWGDKFSSTGTDLHMCRALDARVRAIDFRAEDPSKLPTDQFNIVSWSGSERLQDATLCYLQSRNAASKS